MKKSCCHIIGAGDFSPELLKPEENDLVIACDGGYKALLKAGIECQICIGDFDSLGHIPNGSFDITVLPTVKDVTDTHAACQKALELGYNKIRIYGALGGNRFSHSIANIQLVCQLCNIGCDVMIIDKNCTVIPIKNGEISFPKEQKGFISVFAMDSSVIYSNEGLKYSVKNQPLDNMFPLGVSNEFTSQPSKIKIDGGMGIVITEPSLN